VALGYLCHAAKAKDNCRYDTDISHWYYLLPLLCFEYRMRMKARKALPHDRTLYVCGHHSYRFALSHPANKYDVMVVKFHSIAQSAESPEMGDGASASICDLVWSRATMQCNAYGNSIALLF